MSKIEGGDWDPFSKIPLPEIMKQVEEAEQEFTKRLDTKKQAVENDPEVVALALEIDQLCAKIIGMGKKTEGNLIDENGPFSKLEDLIKKTVLAYEKKIGERFAEHPTPLSRRMLPKYISEHFLSSTRFPYLKITMYYEFGDKRAELARSVIEVELNDTALVDAIDAK